MVELGMRWIEFSGHTGSDPILSRAVLHSLMIIGEAANRIPADLRTRYPDVPWRDLAALRNRIVHDYQGVDLELVWRLIRKRLGKLRHQIASIWEAEGLLGSDFPVS